jgi:uncharacterized protein with ParB-like and HNH nuclease domain
MINIESAFRTENKSVFEYFQKPGVGFYIPLYQRDYSWDKGNVEQFLEDITSGVENLLDNEDNEIRFLGTIITVAEKDLSQIRPQDPKSLPTSIEKIIDGQQRLSTIALFSTLLHFHIGNVLNNLLTSIENSKNNEIFKSELKIQVTQISEFWQEKLVNIFAVDLKRGTPTLKPKIIRGNEDKWVFEEKTNTSYISNVSKHLFTYIDHINNKKSYVPKFKNENKVDENLSIFNEWLTNKVIIAHLKNDDSFSTAFQIIENSKQENIWQFERENIKAILYDGEHNDKGSISYNICSLIQILITSHYLIERCCFTIIQPISDDWAFDMFQSLNGTGTPLTAIETFRPLVMKIVKDSGEVYENSEMERSFSKIQAAFINLSTAALKSKKTNDLLTSFALPVEGYKLATHFSTQRRWLDGTITKKCIDYDTKSDFIHFFGNYTEFFHKYWHNYKSEKNEPLDIIQNEQDGELASILFLFLKECNHTMSLTVIGTFYHQYLIKRDRSTLQDFINSIKLISAFYILWRSTKSNTGLDEAYRIFFKGHVKLGINPHNFIDTKKLELNEIKSYFKNTLTRENINITKADWINTASKELRYTTSTKICKLALFVSYNNTIPDSTNPGLIKNGISNCAPYLKLERWNHDDLKSIEHIAPDTNDGSWCLNLYDDRKLAHSLGNLTLLPLQVNISASNRGWEEKILYYKHLGLTDPQKIEEITEVAKNNGIHLKASTIDLLKKSNYAAHINSIIEYDQKGIWDEDIVKKRTINILEIFYDKIYPWIL